MTGVVDPTTLTAYANPTTSIAGSNQSVCGITSVTLNGNTPSAGTGTWSVLSGSGGTIFSPNSPASQFNGVLPNTYNLQWTISNGNCKSSSDVTIAFTTRPTPPSAANSQSFCNSATIGNISVSVPIGNVNWYTSSTYPPSGGGLISSTALTSGTTYYADAVSGTCVSAPPLTPVTITIYPLPIITSAAATAAVCNSTSAQTTTLAYGAVTNSPNKYSITWNNAAITAGLVNVSNATITASPIIVSIAPNVAAGDLYRYNLRDKYNHWMYQYRKYFYNYREPCSIYRSFVSNT